MAVVAVVDTEFAIGLVRWEAEIIIMRHLKEFLSASEMKVYLPVFVMRL